MTPTRYRSTVIAILILGAILRFSFLDNIPQGLHHQEASIGIFIQKLINYPLTISGIRLPFAIINLLGLLGSIVLTEKMFHKKNLSLWVGFILAISPWHFWLGRTASLLNILYFIYMWILVFIPSKGRLLVLILTATLLTISPIFNDAPLSLLKDTTYTDNLNTFRGQAGSVGQLFFNKSQIFIRIINNLLGAFNPSFIFARGDGNLLNQPTNYGPMLVSFLPFCLFGLIRLIKNNLNNKNTLFYWILISTLPCLFLLNSPQTDKLILLFYPLSIFTALGISYFKFVSQLFIGIILVFNLSVVVYNINYKQDYLNSKTFYPQTLELTRHINTKDRYWLTDSINPNPLPVIAFSKGSVANITTGNFASVEAQTDLAYDTYILDNKQLERLLTLNKQLRGVVVSDINGYLIVKLSYEKQI